MICKEYGIKVRFIKLLDEDIDGSHVVNSKVGTENIIYIVNYRNHYVPLLSSMKKDTKRSIKVSGEEVYGNIVGLIQIFLNFIFLYNCQILKILHITK